MWKQLRDEGVRLAAEGDYERATEVGRAAIEACAAELGRESVECARCVLCLAVTHNYRSVLERRRDDAEEALRLALEAHATAERAVGPDDPRLADYSQWVARTYLELGRLDEAGEILERAVRAIERDDRRDDVAAKVLGTFASVLFEQKQFARLDAVAARRAAILEALLGATTDRVVAESHRHELATACWNQAHFLLHQGRSPEAVPHLERALARFEQCHDAGVAFRQVFVDSLVQTAQSVFDGAARPERYAPFKALADSLLTTPGPRGLWESIRFDTELVVMAMEANDAEIAAILLRWLRGEKLAPPLAGFAVLEHMLPKLRARMGAPGSTLLAFFPMSLELVVRGEKSLNEALEDCAVIDAHEAAR